MGRFPVPNGSDGFTQIIGELKRNKTRLTFMEATGGLESVVACHLQSEGFDVVVINPRSGSTFFPCNGLSCEDGSY